ncbi:MAG: phosphonate C-P lyase system protein PhnG [Litorilinea sp.]
MSESTASAPGDPAASGNPPSANPKSADQKSVDPTQSDRAPFDPTDQRTYLEVLAAASPAPVKELAELLLAELPQVEVLENRTGLVMLPYVESVAGQSFHLGEVLVAEARVRVHGQEGYAACLGRDLEQTLAIAIVDAVMQGQDAAFSPALRAAVIQVVQTQHAAHAQADDTLLRKVEATRIELETF